MLLKVASDDVASYRSNNRWLIHHPNEALIFKDLKNVWSELRPIYDGDFKSLVYGELPPAETILQTFQIIEERLASVEWTIKVE
ncbi:hypothetical protein KIH41_17150 [Litoribacter ruber]|uniref:hypothetical protein n=1 Tax=Litoribacter ruber TaxID=702568 RepID=UPI001BDB297E|nr:hypothetical protein [Litoribacter ruber]MBT0813018.1 hypothetical protein [Litoribacter ruber]